MNSFDYNQEKARKRQKLTNLFRFIELVIFLIAVSRFSLPLAYKFPGDCFRGLANAVFSPRFVFVLGNVIVLFLFLKASGHYSSQKESTSQLKLDQSSEDTEDIPYPQNPMKMKMNRSQSEIFKREKLVDSSRKLRRSVTETRWKVSEYKEEMSGEEFRQTVEAFIARQQKSLREEESKGFYQ